jgi:hypothetical protein
MASLPGFTPSYDANGNVTNDSLHTYSWDAEGRPVTIDGVGLTCDGLGRMVEQNVSGAYTQIVYAPQGKQAGAYERADAAESLRSVASGRRSGVRLHRASLLPASGLVGQFAVRFDARPRHVLRYRICPVW